MLRVSCLWSLVVCTASLLYASERNRLLSPGIVAHIRPETTLLDDPTDEGVVSASETELADADSDMPEDEDLEYLTYDCETPWMIVANVVWLQRAELNNGAVLVDDASDATLLDSHSLDFDHRAGFDLTAAYSANSCSGYELRFFWLDDWTAAARSANPGLVNIGTSATTGPFATTTFDTSYRSRFNSAEASIRRPLGELTLLVGVRYALVDEEMLIRGFGGGAESNARFATQNDLIGLQVGIAHNWRSPCSPWGVAGVAKIGAYYNTADADAALEISGAPIGSASDNAESLAFLAEAGIDAAYCPRANVTLRAGYRLLFVDGVALAAEQIDRTGSLQVLNATLATHDDGTLLAHGFTAGVELRW